MSWFVLCWIQHGLYKHSRADVVVLTAHEESECLRNTNTDSSALNHKGFWFIKSILLWKHILLSNAILINTNANILISLFNQSRIDFVKHREHLLKLNCTLLHLVQIYSIYLLKHVKNDVDPYNKSTKHQSNNKTKKTEERSRTVNRAKLMVIIHGPGFLKLQNRFWIKTAERISLCPSASCCVT